MPAFGMKGLMPAAQTSDSRPDQSKLAPQQL